MTNADLVAAALAELVTLNDIAKSSGFDVPPDVAKAFAERKEAAWEAARKALGQTQKGN